MFSCQNPMFKPTEIAVKPELTSGPKTLKMLDHVMLWVARFFSLFLFAWSVGEFTEDATVSNGVDFGSFVLLLVGTFASLNVWLINVQVCRLALALYSAWAVIIFCGLTISTDVWHSSMSPFSKWMTYLGAPGFFAAFWIAIRPSFRNRTLLIYHSQAC
jgi:hypothetical protein